jgi:signal transduction histidine kinase
VAPKASEKIQSRIEMRTWWLIGLSILMILGFSVTIPLLLLSLVRAGVLQGVLPADGGFSLVVGLLGLAAVFSLNLIYQQSQINLMRRRIVQDQMDLEQSKSRLGELTSLLQLGNTLQMDLPLQTVLEITVRRIASTLHAHDVDLFLLSRETKSLHVAASFGLTRRPPEPEVPYGEGPVGWCARHREPVLLVAGGADSPFGDYAAARSAIGSILFLPIQVEKRCVGVLQISRAASADPFRPEHRDVAKGFADSLGPVIDRARGAASLRQNTAAVAAAAVPTTQSAAGSFEDAFLQSASQELKSPLTAMVAYSEVLEQNDKRMTPAMRSEFVGRIRSEADRTMGLIDDVLDLVRLELGRYVLELRVGNLNRVVRDALEAVTAVAGAKEVTLEARLDETIPDQHLDGPKMLHSIVHLLRNAVRYSPTRGRVIVETKLGDGDVRVTVIDGGPALDPDRPDSAFELGAPGTTEGTTKRARASAGFGLHLTKRFVELHGGNVGASTGVEGASTFWIQLPWGGDLSTLVGGDPFAEELARS